MPKHPHNHDPLDFSIRLKEAMTDSGWNTGHGAGALLSRRYKAATVTSNAWLNGLHMPSADRVRTMADDLGVRFEWLYFGKLPKRISKAAIETRQDALTLTAHEQQLIRKYRASGEALQGLVDAALKTAETPTPPKDKPRKPK